MARVLEHSLVVATGHDPSHLLIILHGAFGAGRNWGAIARRLVAARPEWGVVLPDLRLHGTSQGFPPPHTLDAAADDVRELTHALGKPINGILGHSLGGKVALLCAGRRPVGLQQVWVVESTPAAAPPSGSAWRMLEAVRALPADFASRQEAADGLVRSGFESLVAQWMTANLVRVNGRFRWRLDFVGLEMLLREFFRTDAWSIVADPPAGVDLHFVKAAHSDTLDEDALNRLRAIAATHPVYIHIVEGGHWIHTDNPDAVSALLANHLP